jgi:hypothetical protein
MTCDSAVSSEFSVSSKTVCNRSSTKRAETRRAMERESFLLEFELRFVNRRRFRVIVALKNATRYPSTVALYFPRSIAESMALICQRSVTISLLPWDIPLLENG